MTRLYSVDLSVFGYEVPCQASRGCLEVSMTRDAIEERFREWKRLNHVSEFAFRVPDINGLTAMDGQVAAEKYVGLKEWGWYLGDLHGWKHLLETDGPIRALEIGAFDGVSANLMLDELFHHQESEVHCIDPFLPDPTTPQVGDETREDFFRNREIGGHGERIHLYEGLSVEVLAWMISEDGFWESFDFIYVDGSHLASDVLTDAVMSWNLLKYGGVIAFDDYQWRGGGKPYGHPKLGIDHFESAFYPHLGVLQSGYRKIWQRV